MLRTCVDTVEWLEVQVEDEALPTGKSAFSFVLAKPSSRNLPRETFVQLEPWTGTFERN